MRRSFQVGFFTGGNSESLDDDQASTSIVLIRAPIMPMLFVDGIEYDVLKAPFKCPLRREDVAENIAAQESIAGRRKTLGCRRRYGTESILRYKPQPQSGDSDADDESLKQIEKSVNDEHRLVLWRGENGHEVVVDPRLSGVLRDHQ
ncbi:DNA repair and recombination protein RAD54-like, partial [Perkinsus olseni]